MSSDVEYNKGKSIVDLPITDPIHRPCPDMAGMTNPDPDKRRRAIFLLQKLREKHGLTKGSRHEN